MICDDCGESDCYEVDDIDDDDNLESEDDDDDVDDDVCLKLEQLSIGACALALPCLAHE